MGGDRDCAEANLIVPQALHLGWFACSSDRGKEEGGSKAGEGDKEENKMKK